MRNAKLLALAAGIVFMLAACSSAAPGTSQAPGATTPPGGATPASGGATPVPPGPGGGAACTGVPTMNPTTGDMPSLVPDTGLEAHFPSAIDGQPVTNVQSAYFAQWICAFSGQAGLDRFSHTLPNGLNLATLSWGSADATVDDESVSMDAYRAPGQDANLILTGFAGFIAAIGGDPSAIQGTLTPASVGGKNVSIFTDATDGSKTYVYIGGDTLITVGDVTDSQAGKIFAAIP